MGSQNQPVALVIGASGRLGRCVARALDERGYALALVGGKRRVDAYPGSSSHRADFTDAGEASRIVAEAFDAHGRVDAVAWAAGVVQRPRVDLLEVTASDLDRQWAVNVRAPFLLSTSVARRWLSSPASSTRSIVIATSMAASVADPELAAYCTAKSEASGMVATLALRLATEGVLVTEVAPGFLADVPGLPARVPSGKAAGVEEVARLMAALAAGDFPAVTGQRLVAAGGAQIPRLTGH